MPNLVYPTVPTLRRGFADGATNMTSLFASRTNDPRFNNLATLSPCGSVVNPDKEGRCPAPRGGHQLHQAYAADEQDHLRLPNGLTAERLKGQADRHSRPSAMGAYTFDYWPIWMLRPDPDSLANQQLGTTFPRTASRLKKARRFSITKGTSRRFILCRPSRGLGV